MANIYNVTLPFITEPGGVTPVVVAVRDSVTRAATSGLPMIYSVLRRSDGKWWKSGTATWEVLFQTNALTPAAADSPGLYLTSLDWTVLEPLGGEDDYYIQVVEDGEGDYEYATLSTRNGLSSTPVADSVVPAPGAASWTLADLFTLIKVALSHNQEIDDATKTQIFYKADGVTPALEFDLKDATGAASVREVFQKVR